MFCHEYGFAGTSDTFAMYDGQPTILDFKTQGDGNGDKPSFYRRMADAAGGVLHGLA